MVGLCLKTSFSSDLGSNETHTHTHTEMSVLRELLKAYGIRFLPSNFCKYGWLSHTLGNFASMSELVLLFFCSAVRALWFVVWLGLIEHWGFIFFFCISPRYGFLLRSKIYHLFTHSFASSVWYIPVLGGVYISWLGKCNLNTFYFKKYTIGIWSSYRTLRLFSLFADGPVFEPHAFGFYNYFNNRGMLSP